MKYIALFLTMVLLLSGCAGPNAQETSVMPTETPAVSTEEEGVLPTESTEHEEAETVDGFEPADKNLEVREIPEAVTDAAIEYASDDADYALGTGVYAAASTEEGILYSEDIEVFPLFRDETLEALLIGRESFTAVNDEALIREVGPLLGTDFMFVATGPATLACVNAEKIVVVCREEGRSDPSENRMLQWLQEKEMKNNPLGNKMWPVPTKSDRSEVTDPESGKSYSSSRIVVTLKESSDETVREIEEKLGVTLFRKQSQGKVCVFVTESPKNFKALEALVKKAVEIENVEKAVLDGVNELHGNMGFRPPAAMI